MDIPNTEKIYQRVIELLSKHLTEAELVTFDECLDEDADHMFSDMVSKKVCQIRPDLFADPNICLRDEDSSEST